MTTEKVKLGSINRFHFFTLMCSYVPIALYMERRAQSAGSPAPQPTAMGYICFFDKSKDTYNVYRIGPSALTSSVEMLITCRPLRGCVPINPQGYNADFVSTPKSVAEMRTIYGKYCYQAIAKGWKIKYFFNSLPKTS